MFKRDVSFHETVIGPSPPSFRLLPALVLGALLALAFLLAATLLPGRRDAAADSRVQDSCLLFCGGPLLDAVQKHRLFSDSKTFVDMPAALDPSDVLAAFALINSSDGAAVAKFVASNFLPAGSDSLSWYPSDFESSPPSLSALRNASLREFAHGLHDLWLSLGRRTSADVQRFPQRFSLIWLPHGSVVPGQRFSESYLWDSYWVVLGLQRSGMIATAEGIVLNLLHLLQRFGFVPNGGRVYYASPGRSQPPLLSHMIADLLARTGNASVLEAAFPSLLKEHAWWIETHSVCLSLDDSAALERRAVDSSEAYVRSFNASDACDFVLNRFVTIQRTPRAESYIEDLDVAASAGLSGADAGELFGEITAATESGWDFSERFFGKGGLGSSHTSAVLPADLNGILYGYERNLEHFAAVLREVCRSSGAPCVLLRRAARCGEAAQGAVAADCLLPWLAQQEVIYREAAERRARAIDALLWSEASGHWRDVTLVRRQAASGGPSIAQPRAGSRLAPSTLLSASDYVPLWAGAYDRANKTRIALIVRSLAASELLCKAGIASTLARSSHQQWDFPNGWAPLQHMIVEGLLATGDASAARLAESVARKWTRASLKLWESGYMHEKIDVVQGKEGGGGEYLPQVGFAWTNAVLLDFVVRYDWASLEDEV